MKTVQVCSSCAHLQATWTTWRLQWTLVLLIICSLHQNTEQTLDTNSFEMAQQPQRAGVADRSANGIAGRSLRRGAVEKFTIIPHYDSSIYKLTLQQQAILKNVLVHSAVQWFSETIKVRPMATNITFERSCTSSHYLINGLKYCRNSCASSSKCGPVTIPENHLTPCRKCSRSGLQCEGGESVSEEGGVGGGHFLLYVSALKEAHCGKASAYPGTSLVEAKHCLQEESFDRPVAGYINFCPNVLSPDTAQLSVQQHAVMHELLHALVFSDNLFPFFHNEEGYPRSRRTLNKGVARYPDGSYDVDPNTLRQIRKTKWTVVTPGILHPVKMIVTPNVVREVRDHFDCSTLIGAELENQGGWGVAGVHWESRLFGDELMTASVHTKPVLSKITLALMEDSGWYLPDYTYGGHLLWGRGKGCPFVDDSCGGWRNYADENREPLAPFCDGLDYRHNKRGCVNGRTGLGPCFIRNYTIPLPVEYQYLSRRKGGTQFLADYCPLYAAMEYSNFRIGNSCLNPDHAPPVGANVAGEVYSPESRCFEQAQPIKRLENGEEQVASNPGAGCYQFTCSSRQISVQIGNQTVLCRKKGQKRNFTYEHGGVTYTGSIMCPDYSDVCSEYDCLNMCSDHGTCSLGECKCNYGYHGEDCSQSFAQRLLSCDEITCLNGGNCVDVKSGGFSCECLSEFTGAFCEQDRVPDPCLNVTCNGNGICSRTNGSRDARCDCYHGYDGNECRRFADLCALNGKPCLNNHSCTINATTCECSSEFWGAQCEKVKDFCSLHDPCRTGELCIHHNTTQNYTCKCPDGYTGENCAELLVDHCAKQPCANNGTCVNLVDEFECLCPRGYKGDKCKNRQNPCKESPCSAHGRCRKVVEGPWGSVYCRCSEDYTGEFCEISPDISLQT